MSDEPDPTEHIVDEAHSTQKHPADEESTDRLFLTFSAEELGKIAVLIITGVKRNEAIRTMPRYSQEQHREYAAFYDQLREVIIGEQDR